MTWRSRFLAAGAAAVLAGCVVVPVVVPMPAEVAQTESAYEHQRRHIADGVWTFVQPGFHLQPLGNVTVIEQSDGFVLVDAGGARGAALRILEQVRSLGSKPIKAVIVTHWHPDHPLGLAEILAASAGARTISTGATKRYLLDRKLRSIPERWDGESGQRFQQRAEQYIGMAAQAAKDAKDSAERQRWLVTERNLRRYAEDIRGTVVLAPTETFERRLAIPDKQRPVEILYLGRANTDGDAVVWLPKQRAIISGDVVVAPIPFGFGSFPKQWVEVLGRIEALRPRVLVPGHGEPQHDLGYVGALKAMLTDLVRQAEALAQAGVSVEEGRKRIDLSAHEPFFTRGDPWMARWFREFWITPIAAAALNEAKGEPIEQKLGA